MFYCYSFKFALIIAVATIQAFADDSDRTRTVHHVKRYHQRSFVGNHHYPRIKRATVAVPPYLALLGYKGPHGDLWLCSASFITRQQLITATDCTKRQPRNYSLETIKINNTEFKIASVTTHDQITLLNISDPTDLVQHPACLSPPDRNLKEAIVAGWGGLLPDNELHGKVNDKIGALEVTVSEILGDTIKVKSNDKNCVADRGGPLQIRSKRPNCKYEIIGLAKEWSSCGSQGSTGLYISIGSDIENI